MAKPHILVVDDRDNMLTLLEKVLRKDAMVHTASSGKEALAILQARTISAVVCDLRMSDLSGLDVLRACKLLRPAAEFILMTAYASVSTAIEAMRDGAYDYVTKPFNPEDLRAVVLRALRRATVTAPDTAWGSAESAEVLPGVLGRSPIMRQLAAQAHRVAQGNAPVLIAGEPGTGKERVARALHLISSRARERFVIANCATIPADLLESELLGCAGGSIAGAASDRAGLFPEAHLGTLFLDEVEELRSSFQAKLTRVLEEKGCAPHHFLRERAATTPKQRSPTFTEDASRALRDFDWPGNVRQLASVVERACIEAGRDPIDVDHLPGADERQFPCSAEEHG